MLREGPMGVYGFRGTGPVLFSLAGISFERDTWLLAREHATSWVLPDARAPGDA